VYCNCRIFAPSAIMVVFSEDDLLLVGSLKRKTPRPESIREHVFLRRRIGAEAARGRPLSRSVEENLHRPSLIAECRKFGVGVWCFDRPADKATRSLLRTMALRQRRDVSHSKSTSCEMRTKRAFCFVPEIAGLSECQSAEPRRRQAHVSSRRFWLFNVRT
jgi:hypothetical protein